MYVEGKMAFQRSFLIFNAEDTGFEAGQKPSGHVKIEVRDGKGKLWSAVQNLTAGDGRLDYKLFLIKTGSRDPAAVCAGLYKFHQNRAELEWGFDPANVSKSGRSIAEFDVAAVLAEYNDRKNLGVRSPLAAYRDKKTEWRKSLEKLLYPPASPKTEEEDFTSKYDGIAVSKYIPPETLPEYNIPDILGSYQKPEAENEPAVSALPPNPYQQQYGIHMPSEAPAQDNRQIEIQADIPQEYSAPITDIPQARSTVVNEEIRGDIDRLKEMLNRYFEQSDPFQSKRSDYRWWKVSNPVDLNNILYQCNIRSPLLFNPMVMMAHFKYKHVIIGIYTDKVRKREYVVCGVPGMNMVDKKPFGDMCKWVQAEGGRPKYGGFGYWIVYIDPGTGKILSLKQ